MHNLFSPSQPNCTCDLENSFLVNGWNNNRLFYFNASQLLANMQPVLHFINRLNPYTDFKTSVPSTYYVAKLLPVDDFFEEYKSLSLPNPIQHLRLAVFLENNVDKLQAIFTNSQSQQNPFLQEKWLKYQNCPLFSSNQAKDTVNPFFANIRRQLSSSLGYRFKLDFEIKNFFNSIYTHQVANLINRWAKLEFANDWDKIQSFSQFARNLDMNVRNCSLKETKGIIEGTSVSLLVSELFLTLLDYFLVIELKKTNIDYRYLRSYQTYTFFLESNGDLELVLNIISDLFLKNKLNFDFSTLEKTKAPFTFKTFIATEKILTDLRLDQSGLGLLKQLHYLQELEKSHRSPGVVKYFLQFLNQEKLSQEKQFNNRTLFEYLQQPFNFLCLLNLIYQKPELTKSITPLLSSETLQNDTALMNDVKNKTEKNLAQILNCEHWDEGILAQIYLSDHLQIVLSPSLLQNIFDQWEHLSSLTILGTLFYLNHLVKNNLATPQHLQLWNKKDVLLEMIFQHYSQWLEKMKKTGHPFDDLADFTQTAVWPLLYEVVQQQWYDGAFANLVKENTFFQFLLKKQISFVDS